jgi:hypothetical protein
MDKDLERRALRALRAIQIVNGPTIANGKAAHDALAHEFRLIDERDAVDGGPPEIHLVNFVNFTWSDLQATLRLLHDYLPAAEADGIAARAVLREILDAGDKIRAAGEIAMTYDATASGSSIVTGDRKRRLQIRVQGAVSQLTSAADSKVMWTNRSFI